MLQSGRWWFCVLMLALGLNSAWAQKVDTKVGVFYYPGWREGASQASANQPWARIQRFKEREPLLGWYEEGTDEVMRQQINWMINYGLNYVVFDWYWGPDNKVYLDHALSAYLRSPERERLPFSILWANHGKEPVTRTNWDRMVDFWVRFYATRPEMLKVDGKPVIFIFLSRQLEINANKFGSSATELLASAQVKARAAGLPGLYFVAGSAGDDAAFLKDAARIGYSAVTMYNLHNPPLSGKLSHSYRELDEAYRAHWKAYESVSSVPIIYPMTSGWDKRPWGGSSEDPSHDKSLGVPSEFEDHLEAAKAAITNGKLRPGQTTRWGVICCWNEFGEGSYIEPTRELGHAVLDKVRRVFGGVKASLRKD